MIAQALACDGVERDGEEIAEPLVRRAGLPLQQGRQVRHHRETALVAEAARELVADPPGVLGQAVCQRTGSLRGRQDGQQDQGEGDQPARDGRGPPVVIRGARPIWVHAHWGLDDLGARDSGRGRR